jgi:hypothetical protein
VHAGHDAHEEIEAYPTAFLETLIDRFRPDAGDSNLAIRFIGELVMHVVGQLAVDADWLQLVEHSVAGTFEHVWKLVGYRFQVSGVR